MGVSACKPLRADENQKIGGSTGKKNLVIEVEDEHKL